MRNIVLVGFMGTGKTAVAKEISRKLGMKYISTDDLIEKKEKISISDIFSQKGENYFRKTERDVIKDVSKMENVVIDAGGGAVIDPENVRNFKKKGVLICLWAEPEVILKRTESFTHRPLLNINNSLNKIKELLDFRKPFYERADYHIRTSNMSVQDVADHVKKVLKNAL